MRLGVDIDGILADFNSQFVDLIISVTGVNRFPEQPFEFPCWDWPAHFGYSKDELDSVWDMARANPRFWLDRPAYPRTTEALRLLSSRTGRDDIYFITNRPGVKAKAQTEMWLRANGLFCRPTVLLSAEKGLCAEALDLQFYIDDNDKNIVDVCNRRGLRTHTFVFDQPWNRTEMVKATDAVRVTSVAEALDLFDADRS